MIDPAERGDFVIKIPVVEKVLPKFVPQMLHRVQFRGIGRKTQEPDVVRNLKLLIPVPAGPIQNHDQTVLGIDGGQRREGRESQEMKGSFRDIGQNLTTITRGFTVPKGKG